ncbi:MAG TPA: gamma carbonic anhydrase family protein [Chloroflexota bacterium]|jgi:carbonic anhydrase/acetyltransferase-like protein (isoleucine patch superfamily)|nr:gamma carbonic anhydrase family protein [Chloroflexota bacterium]
MTAEKHRNVHALGGYEPSVAASVFIAPTATIVGNVSVGEDSSVWFGATLRADHEEQAIVVGARTSIQDGCVIHVSTENGTIIGDDVTVGHGAILEGCTIHDRALIGMNAVVLEGAEVGEGSMVAAGAVVPVGMVIPAGMLVAGVPATIKKDISGGSAAWIDRSASHYVALARRYREQLDQ